MPILWREGWRWKPRLVWACMHMATLGFLQLAGAWPAWERQYMVVLVVVAALYVTISFGDPGYVLAGPSAFSPEPATLASMAVPLMLQTCEQCGVPKPPRAKHCYDCGRCVRRMDHHCWWLGNCVGEETHRLLLFYLTAPSRCLILGTCPLAWCSAAQVPKPRYLALDLAWHHLGA